jgi:hypothetical protein
LVPAGSLPDGSPLTLVNTAYEDSDRAMQVAVMEIPPIEEANVSAALDGGVNGAVEAVGATLDQVTNTELKGYPGRIFTYHGVMEGMAFKGEQHVYLLPGKFLQFIVIAAHDAYPEADFKRFFDSIELD